MQNPQPLIDPFGRVVKDLRISITDRCNFRCRYCMPEEGMQWLGRSELLDFEEIERIARVFVEKFGVNSIRITGGEPSVRAHLPKLISKLASIPSLDGSPVDLAMTTNGATLSLLAQDLFDAGLNRLNISCDSLDPRRFYEITHRDRLDKVLEGIDSALEVGFDSIKLNVVLMRGINEDEVIDFVDFGRQKGIQVRFIEFMPLDGSNEWTNETVVPGDEIISIINSVYPVEALPHGSEPAQKFSYLDGKGEVGVIASVTKPFCGNCDRVRMTAEGKMRTCLFSVDEFDLREIIRKGGTDLDLAKEITRAVGTKWAGHSIGKVNFIKPKRNMSQIGG